MHDVLRNRVIRKIESLPEERIYQVLDYIEFLESRHGATEGEKRASGFQRLAEGLEDRMRKRAFNPSNLREAFQVIAAADRALSGVAQAGREIFDELAGGSQRGSESRREGSSREAGSGDENERRRGGGERPERGRTDSF